MTEKVGESTHTPLYIGMIPEAADCPRHGEMLRQPPPLLDVNGQIHTAIEGLGFYGCPECCLDMFAIAGEPSLDPEQGLPRLWRQYLTTEWNGVIKHLFVDLGPGWIVPREGHATVLFDEEPAETIIPESFHSCAEWFVRGGESRSDE